ncbi:hypothetical protein V8B97DRAFT_1917839 [Scleroderma yunnanense]
MGDFELGCEGITSRSLSVPDILYRVHHLLMQQLPYKLVMHSASGIVTESRCRGIQHTRMAIRAQLQAVARLMYPACLRVFKYFCVHMFLYLLNLRLRTEDEMQALGVICIEKLCFVTSGRWTERQSTSTQRCQLFQPFIPINTTNDATQPGRRLGRIEERKQLVDPVPESNAGAPSLDSLFGNLVQEHNNWSEKSSSAVALGKKLPYKTTIFLPHANMNHQALSCLYEREIAGSDAGPSLLGACLFLLRVA